MKLSMITWAELPKSPNWASHSTRLSGRRPSIRTRSRGRRSPRGAVVQLERRRGVGQVLDRRVAEPGLLVVEDQVAVRERAALGVLARERMWTPSVSSEARRAPRRGRTRCPLVERLDPLLQRLRSLRWIVKLSGTRISSSFSLRIGPSSIAVSTSGLRVRSSSPVPVAVGSSYSPASIFGAAPRGPVSAPLALVHASLDLLAGDDSLGHQRLGVELETGGCSLILAAIIGCV